MFVIKVNKVSSGFAQPTMNICVNIIHKRALKLKRVRRLSVRESLVVISRVLSKLGEITITEIYQTIFSFTGMVLVIQCVN